MKHKVIGMMIMAMLAACNTMKGVGQDIQAAGHAITGGVEEGRQKINQR